MLSFSWYILCIAVELFFKNSFFQEVKNLVLASLLGMPGGVLLFLPLYHPLHDLGGVHSEVTFFILFTVFMAIIWSGDRCQKESSQGNNFQIPIQIM